MPYRKLLLVWLLLAGATAAQASVSLLLEEPYGRFGGMTPTGHAAVYLSNVCAASPVSLRRCREGEHGVVISRYYHVDGVDWVAVPLLPYLYAVDRADRIPATPTAEQVRALREASRREYLASIPQATDGEKSPPDWTELLGVAYTRTIYVFEVETTAAQDDKLIGTLNSSANRSHFDLLFRNCSDFARRVINTIYPHMIHRSFVSDLGIMTPKQAARCVVRFGQRHPSLQFTAFAIPQVPGVSPPSTPVRGVVESLIKSRRYAIPLAPLAALHPYFATSMVVAWIEGSHFNPRRVAEAEGIRTPEAIASEMRTEPDEPGSRVTGSQ